MTAACDMVIMTLEAGTARRPTCLGDKSRPRARDPFLLEDPDEHRLVHL